MRLKEFITPTLLESVLVTEWILIEGNVYKGKLFDKTVQRFIKDPQVTAKLDEFIDLLEDEISCYNNNMYRIKDVSKYQDNIDKTKEIIIECLKEIQKVLTRYTNLRENITNVGQILTMITLVNKLDGKPCHSISQLASAIRYEWVYTQHLNSL